MENGPQHASEPSLAALLGSIVNDAKDLLVQEVALIKLEVQDELRRTKTAAITLGIGIGVVAGGGMLLMLMLVHVLEVFTDISLWGCYGLAGSGLVVLGTVLLAAGKTTAVEYNVVPRQTVEARKATAQEDHRADGRRQDIPEDTQGDIEDIRSAMSEKLEMLEDRVWETVEDAQASVEEIVENVRDTVDTTVAAVKQTVEGAQASVEGMVENVRGTVGETVETVRHTFDVHHQVEQHPWLLLGGVTAVGYLLGSLSSGRSSAALSTTDPWLSPTSTAAATSRASPAGSQPPQERRRGVRERFKDEIAIIEGAVIGSVVRTLGDMVKQALLPAASPLKSDTTKQGSQSGDRPVQTPAARSSTTGNGGAIF
jgi:ElaB/YqjD/DUF883 family membrane-anchored ribosome-binding protein